MKTKLLLIATATLLISGTAATVSLADSHKGGRGMTAERAMSAAEHMFTRIDTDNDGVLSAAELEAAPKRGKRGDKSDKMDQSADGEAMADADSANADADADAGMSDEKGKRDGKGKRKGMGKGKGKGKGKHGNRSARILLGEDGLTAGMTLDDVQAKISAGFADLDANADGTLTRDEIRPAMQAMREARKS